MKPRDHVQHHLQNQAQNLARELARRLEAAGDPARIPGAQAYMKTADPFFGVGAEAMRRQVKELALSHLPKRHGRGLAQVAAFWALPRRRRAAPRVVDQRFPAFRTLDARPATSG
ncbi:MAG: DNA alkylation repair protein [Holophagaceae bacterium]|nr:DNA alkylation repair protein [Holophagaceae bacterium]